MMTNIYCLLPNETELSLLSGKAVEDVDSAREAAKLLLDKGLPAVVVTLGAKGSLVVTKEGAKHIPPFEVQVVDTTGAGDAFIGGFAAALVQGKTPEEAARYGNACGALATTKAGAQSSLPTKEEVEKLLAGR
jgi:ribokinase